MIISLKGNNGGGGQGGDGAKKLISGNEQSLMDANKALHVKTINGQSIAGQGNIDIEGGSGDLKVIVFDENHWDDIVAKVAEMVAPIFEIYKTQGSDAINNMEKKYCIIYDNVPYYGFYADGGEELMMKAGSIKNQFNELLSTKLLVNENGSCRGLGNGGFYMKAPVYASQKGFEGMDDCIKITLSNMLGFEWNESALINCQVDFGDELKGLHIRPKQWDEVRRLGIWVDDWNNEVYFLNDPSGLYQKRVDWNLDDNRRISFYGDWDEDTLTGTLYIQCYGLGNGYKSLHANTTLQSAIDNGTIDVTIESAVLPSVETKLRFLDWDDNQGIVNKPVVLSTGSKPVIIKVYSELDEETQTYTYSTDATADEVREAIKKRNALIHFVDEGNYVQAIMYQGDYVIAQNGAAQIMIGVSGDSVAAFVDDPGRPVTSDGSIEKIIKLTQEEYDALDYKDDMTFYIIVS